MPPVELGLASSTRHLPNRSALSCEAVPINRDCRGIESYGRSSFLLLSTESSSRTPPRVYYCYYHYCFPHVYSFPFFGIFLQPMRERTADGIVPPRPLPILARLPLRERESSFSSIAFGYRGINYPLVPLVLLLLFLYMPIRNHSGKTNSIFFGKTIYVLKNFWML